MPRRKQPLEIEVDPKVFYNSTHTVFLHKDIHPPDSRRVNKRVFATGVSLKPYEERPREKPPLRKLRIVGIIEKVRGRVGICLEESKRGRIFRRLPKELERDVRRTMAGMIVHVSELVPGDMVARKLENAPFLTRTELDEWLKDSL